MTVFPSYNLGDTEPATGDFDPIEPGQYFLTVVDFTLKSTKNGDPMLNVQFEISPGQKFEGRMIWDNIIFPYPDSPAIKILGRSCSFLKCLGEPYKGDFTPNPDNWIAKVCRADIATESYQNKHGETKLKNAVKAYIFDEGIKQPVKPQSSIVEPASTVTGDNIEWD